MVRQKMKHPFAPTYTKVAAPIALVILSLVPSILIRNFLFGVLVLPYSLVVGHPPFPYRDKPWYPSPAGALATAVVWAVIIYVAHCLLSARSRKVPNQTQSQPIGGSS